MRIFWGGRFGGVCGGILGVLLLAGALRADDVRFATPGQRLPGSQLRWDVGFQWLDLNGDGRLDLFMPIGSFISHAVHLNIGTPEAPRFDFGERLAINLTEATAGSPSWQSLEHTLALAVGDLDGDGLPDMLAYDGRMRLLFGEGPNPYSLAWWDQPAVTEERFTGNDGTRSFPSSAQTRAELERYVTGPESMMWGKGVFARRVLTLGIADWDRDGRNDMLVNLFEGEAPGVARMVAEENEYWMPWGRTGIYNREWNHPTNATYQGPLDFTPARRTYWYRNSGTDRAYFDDKQEFLSGGQPVDAPNPVLFDVTGNGFPDLVGTETAYTGNAFRVDWPTAPHVFYYPAASADPAGLGARQALLDSLGNPIPAGMQVQFADLRGVSVADLFVLDVGGTLRWYRNLAAPGQPPVFQASPETLRGTDFLRFNDDFQPLVVDWFGAGSRDLLVHGTVDVGCKYGLRRTALYRNTAEGGGMQYVFEGWLNLNGAEALVPQEWPWEDMAQDAHGSMIGVMPVETWTDPRLVVSVSGRLYLLSGLQADKLTFTNRVPLNIPNPGRNRIEGGWQTVPVNQTARYLRLSNSDWHNGQNTAYGLGFERDGLLSIRRLEALENGTNLATPARGVTIETADGGAFNPNLLVTNMLNPGEDLGYRTQTYFGSFGNTHGPAVVDLQAQVDLEEVRFLLSSNQWRTYNYSLPGGTWWPFFWQNQGFNHGIEPGEAWYSYKVEVSTDKTNWTLVADRMDCEMVYSFPYFTDWNGDGKMDLLLGVVNARVTRPVTNEYRLYLNQGDNEAPLYTDHTVLLRRPANPEKPGAQCTVQLLERGGVTNLVVLDNSTSGPGANNVRKEIFAPVGGEYVSTGEFLGHPAPISFRSGGLQNTHFHLADVDGDGIPDLLDNSARNAIFFFKGTRDAAPPAVADLRRLAGPEDSVVVRWTKPAGATHYALRWRTGERLHALNAADATVIAGAYGAEATQDLTVAGLPDGARVSLAVTSYSGTGDGSALGNVIEIATTPWTRRVFRNGPAGAMGEAAYAGADAVTIYGDYSRRHEVGSRELWLNSRYIPGDQPELVLLKFTDLPAMTTALHRARLEMRLKPTYAGIWGDPLSLRMTAPLLLDMNFISLYAVPHDWDPAVVSFNVRRTGEDWGVNLLTGGVFVAQHVPFASVWSNERIEWDVTAAVSNLIQTADGAVGFLLRVDYIGPYNANIATGVMGVNDPVEFRPRLVFDLEASEDEPAVDPPPPAASASDWTNHLVQAVFYAGDAHGTVVHDVYTAQADPDTNFDTQGLALRHSVSSSPGNDRQPGYIRFDGFEAQLPADGFVIEAHLELTANAASTIDTGAPSWMWAQHGALHVAARRGPFDQTTAKWNTLTGRNNIQPVAGAEDQIWSHPFAATLAAEDKIAVDITPAVRAWVDRARDAAHGYANDGLAMNLDILGGTYHHGTVSFYDSETAEAGKRPRLVVKVLPAISGYRAYLFQPGTQPTSHLRTVTVEDAMIRVQDQNAGIPNLDNRNYGGQLGWYAPTDLDPSAMLYRWTGLALPNKRDGVVDARLRLSGLGGWSQMRPDTANWEIRKLRRPWVEGVGTTGVPSEEGVTWNHFHAVAGNAETNQWTTPGGLGAEDSESLFTLQYRSRDGEVLAADTNGVFTALVRDWIAGGANHGVMIRATTQPRVDLYYANVGGGHRDPYLSPGILVITRLDQGLLFMVR